MDTITPTTTRHADSDTVAAELRSAYGVREISDGVALAIASWWQSSGTVGRTLAALASGHPVDVTALLDDVAATRREADARHALDAADGRALDMLSTWAINHPSRGA